MDRGIFIGVGVGPGDPELMTVKAVKTIEEADVLMLPAGDKESCRAYNIAAQACGNIGDKECLFEPFPMKMDREELMLFHERVAKRTEAYLERGRNVIFLTIGSPSLYSTFDYVEEIVRKDGYMTGRVSGVPSFIAAADRLDISLGREDNPVHVLPASIAPDEALKLPGTKVFMKTGRRLAALKEALIRYEQEGGMTAGISECTLPWEEAVYSASEIPDDWGYMNILIADGWVAENK